MVVLVGAGIGVTPFASVLADLVNRLESKKCKLCGEVRLAHIHRPGRRGHVGAPPWHLMHSSGVVCSGISLHDAHRDGSLLSRSLCS